MRRLAWRHLRDETAQDRARRSWYEVWKETAEDLIAERVPMLRDIDELGDNEFKSILPLG